MRRLLLDCGNTRLKWALASGRLLSAYAACAWADVKTAPDPLAGVSAWLKENAVDRVHIANVRGAACAQMLRDWVAQQKLPAPQFARSQAAQCGVHNGYADAAQLGVDRWLALIAAWAHYRRAVVVVDCGTAVTVDALNAQGKFCGGVIAPGLGLLRRALHEQTALLPESAGRAESVSADNTQAAIAAGTLQLLIGGVAHLLAEQRKVVGADAALMITGGAAENLHRHWQPCDYDPHLVLRGLNTVAEVVE